MINHKPPRSHRLRRRVLTPGAALIAAVVAMPAAAYASTATLYVGHGAIGDGSSCSSPGYDSVQAAVNAAASGSTVYLCGGQFAEQVFVSQSLTLTGDPGSGLTASGVTFAGPSAYPPAVTRAPQALLVVTGGSVEVSGLTITGGSTDSSCANDEFGILAIGGELDASNDQVLGVADTNSALWGCQFGVGIQVGRNLWGVAATANITGTLISGYQKNGITVDGSGSSAVVAGDTVVGGGAGGEFDPVIAQNGVQISRGATATVVGNTISDNTYTGAGEASATGVLVYGGGGDPLTPNVRVEGNSLTGNDIGVDFANYNLNFSGPAATVTADVANGNRITDAADTNASGLVYATGVAGYQAGIEDVGDGDRIDGNAISGAGYAPQGTYDSTTNVFTATGKPAMFARPIDAGTGFPTTNVSLHGNSYDGRGYPG